MITIVRLHEVNMRKVDKTKKSNIKCEHCKHYKYENKYVLKNHCGLNGNEKNYWNRCKQFEWCEYEIH